MIMQGDVSFSYENNVLFTLFTEILIFKIWILKGKGKNYENLK